MLFKRRRLPTATSTEIEGLAELARSRGWQPLDGTPFDHDLVDQIWHLTWTLHDHGEPPGGRAGSSVQVPRRPTFRSSYRGEVDGRRIVVTDHSTNIGPGAKNFARWAHVAVCAAELGAPFPILMIKPRALPYGGRLPTVPSGDPEFDERFNVVSSPLLEPQHALTPDVKQRIMARDDWAFLGHDGWLVCVSRERFETGDDVTRLLDEVFDIIGALPATVVPAQIDRSVDDLAARIEKISTIDEALTFLQELSTDDRQRLAASNTPLAQFADVTTPEEARARFESLDVPARMQLLGMFQRLE